MMSRIEPLSHDSMTRRSPADMVRRAPPCCAGAPLVDSPSSPPTSSTSGRRRSHRVNLMSRMLLCVLSVGGAACPARAAQHEAPANGTRALYVRDAVVGHLDGSGGVRGAAQRLRAAAALRSDDALAAGLGEGVGEEVPCDYIADDAEVLGPVTEEFQTQPRSSSHSPGTSSPSPLVAGPRPDTSAAPTRTSAGRTWAGDIGPGRRILQAKKGKGKRAARLRITSKITECPRCAIERCGRPRCYGKCYKRGKVFNCNARKSDFRTCQRADQRNEEGGFSPETLPIDALEPLSAIVATMPPPFIPCVETANHPTGCPVPGTPAVVHSQQRVVLNSTCVSVRYELSDCESPFFPFGYCACMYGDEVDSSVTGQPTGPCRIDHFDPADLPLTVFVEATSDTRARVETRISAHVYDAAEPQYSYNATFPELTGRSFIKVGTMAYFRGFSVLADRFTFTGEFDDSDYTEDAVPAGQDAVVECSDTDAADYDGDYSLTRGFSSDYFYYSPEDTPFYAGDYSNDNTDYGDYGAGADDYDGGERSTYCHYVYSSGGYSGDYIYGGDYDGDDDDGDDAVQAEVDALTAAAEEYYFEQRYFLNFYTSCFLDCSVEGQGVLGSVQDVYGVDGEYSVYYDGPPVPSSHCDLCTEGASTEGLDNYSVFLGEVPEESKGEKPPCFAGSAC